MTRDFFKRTSCRACLAKSLTPVLSLGRQPLANAFVRAHDLTKSEKTFPLAIEFCGRCSMVQLSHVVNPAVLFADYHYLTSASAPLIEHFSSLANTIASHVSVHDLVVEIGSNDGTLLQALKGRCRVLGVDPAKNVAWRAVSLGVRTIPTFFSNALAEEIVRKEGAARVIVANNVIAHIDDLDDVVRGVRTLLDAKGFFLFEVHWVGNLIGKGGFDQIYHEHLSYFSLHALSTICTRFGLVLADVTVVPIHGESLQVTVRKSGSPSRRVHSLLQKERKIGLTRVSTYRTFARKVETTRRTLRTLILDLRKEGKTIVGYGAPAKGNTLLNYVRFTSKHLTYITDTTPLKWDRFAPGSHIRIVPPERLRTHRPDYILLLAWNYAPQILEKEKVLRKRGTKFIIPVPSVRII